MLRILIIVTTLAATTWGGVWLLKSRAWESDLTAWMEQRRAEGWQAEWSEVEVRGFPNRLDTTLHDVALADTQAGWAWTAPFVQVFSLIYSPQDVIVVLPQDSVLQTPRDRYRLHGDDIRASLSLDPEPGLGVQRVTAVLSGIGLARDGGAAWTAQQMRLAAERKPQDPTGYRLGLALQGITPPKGLGPTGATASVQADISVWFDTGWDRRAVEIARPQPRRIEIDRADVTWGALQIQAAGALDITGAGTPEGRLTLKLVNWREVLALAVDTGALPADLARPIESALELASTLSGRADTLDIPLDMRRGRIFLGPIPVGDAPRLRLR